MALSGAVSSARVEAIGQACRHQYQGPAAGGQAVTALRPKPPSVGASLTPQAVISTLLSLDVESSALSLQHAMVRPPLALVLTVAGRSPPRQPSSF
jgi:hypothetical protein